MKNEILTSEKVLIGVARDMGVRLVDDDEMESEILETLPLGAVGNNRHGCPDPVMIGVRT